MMENGQADMPQGASRVPGGMVLKFLQIFKVIFSKKHAELGLRKSPGLILSSLRMAAVLFIRQPLL